MFGGGDAPIFSAGAHLKILPRTSLDFVESAAPMIMDVCRVSTRASGVPVQVQVQLNVNVAIDVFIV